MKQRYSLIHDELKIIKMTQIKIKLNKFNLVQNLKLNKQNNTEKNTRIHILNHEAGDYLVCSH